MLLATEQCLLNPNRNPGLAKTDIEKNLREYLGVRQVIWLGEGIWGDDTDGHIDDIARFVDERTIVHEIESDPADENYEPLRDNFRRLSLACGVDGKPLRLVPLPMPAPVFGPEGNRLPASYANFYIASAVLVPTFNCPTDAQALEILQSVFPNRRVLGIDCRVLLRGLGAIHCATLQQPAVV